MKPDLPEPPLWRRLGWAIRGYATWPATVRKLKAEGFHRTGWMTWTSADD